VAQWQPPAPAQADEFPDAPWINQGSRQIHQVFQNLDFHQEKQVD